MRNAAGEVAGAVDRIDHPGARPIGAAALLADEAVAGKGAVEAIDDELLDLAVDDGEEILRTLERDLAGAALAVVSPHEQAGLVGDRAGRQGPLLEVALTHVRGPVVTGRSR